MADTALKWLESQREAMTSLLISWSEINSSSRNLTGLARMADALESEFASLGAAVQRDALPNETLVDSSGNAVESPLGQALSLVKRPKAPIRVLLNIHYDTVFAAQHPFQRTRLIDDDTLNGPGVVDAKGGIVVMLFALRAFEQSATANKLGWEVILNPDEEIGSPGSAKLLREAAKRNHLGLLFEPAMPDGSLVGERKGTGNFTAVVRGRAAHAGRDFDAGRSATVALADFVLKLDAINRDMSGVTVNCGKIEGGAAVNIVADLAIGRFNARVSSAEAQRTVEARIDQVVREVATRDGITIQLHGGFHAPPKLLDPRTQMLMDDILQAARELGMNLTHKPSGGASDGNKLAAAGLPVVDTLGPVGGNLHSDQEYIKLPSLVERAKLATLVLLKLADGKISPQLR